MFTQNVCVKCEFIFLELKGLNHFLNMEAPSHMFIFCALNYSLFVM